MKLKKNSLTIKIWSYLIIFSIAILAFLWLFQIIFLNKFYEQSKTKELNDIVNKVNKEFQNNTLLDNIDSLSKDSGICLELVENNTYLYSSTTFNRNCLEGRDSSIYKQQFLTSGSNKQTYRLINPRFNNQTLVTAIKLDENIYFYSSISLQPLDSTIDILKNQLVIVTFVVLILSFIIAYFISKKISNPIIKINEMAKNLSKENKISFTTDEDINEINELVKTLNETSLELSKVEELRRELMANVGHDLKTPLTMIKAYAEMIRDLTYKNKEKRNENLNIIIEETNRLNLLVNDIIDLSQIQAKAITLNYEKFDLTSLIKNIIHRYDILVEQENYNIIFEETKKIEVYADKVRIEQVIYNLLNNAINYTGKDKKIIINIVDKQNSYIVEVIDSGKGINPKDINLIWDKYYKTDKTHSRDKVGSGIGLSIVKSILISHKFRFGVESKKGKETKFWFEIKREN